MLIKMYIQYPYPDIDIINIIRMTNMLAILNINFQYINININKILIIGTSTYNYNSICYNIYTLYYMYICAQHIFKYRNTSIAIHYWSLYS